MIRFLYLLFTVQFIHFSSLGQATYTGKVIDLYTRAGIGDAEVFVVAANQKVRTKANGDFSIRCKTLKKSDSIVITKQDYIKKVVRNISKVSEWSMTKKSYNYLPTLFNTKAFLKMQSVPFNHVFGDVKTVKFLYQFKDDKIYYINSSKYLVHHPFAVEELGYAKSAMMFSNENYHSTPERQYVAGYLNHFQSSNTYTIDFHAGNGASCEDVYLIYNKIKSTTFIGDKLLLYANNSTFENCKVPKISDQELYSGQNFQALNAAETYGYLRKVNIKSLDTTFLSRHDIALVNGIPSDISVVAGIVSTVFQSPLCHINVLSHNRKTPNMALRNAWEDPKIKRFENQLVYLKVTLDSFQLRAASLEEANRFWERQSNKKPQQLKKDITTKGLVELKNASHASVYLIGGKAANYAELMKINIRAYSKKIPLPENAFAIPFYYYQKHLEKAGLDKYIAMCLNDSLFFKEPLYKHKCLKTLQDSILKVPVDTVLIRLVKNQLLRFPNYETYRFRSSTNAEDVEGFNGAGLYDSYTGGLNKKNKTVENAIRKVWASLWNVRAFEEREYFKIDQKSIAMGILVHRSFPTEVANGVVITKNLYNQYNDGMVINVQLGETSVVKPEDHYLPDQILYTNYGVRLYVGRSSLPEMKGKTVLTNREIEEIGTYCQAIQDHYSIIKRQKKIMDIEFKVDIVDNKRKLYIKQARVY